VLGPDVVAVRRLRRSAREPAAAVGGGQPVVRRVPAPDPPEPRPDRVGRPVPRELVCVHQPARRRRAHDHPRQEAVAGRQAEVAGRFPTAPADVVEGLLGVGRQRISGLGLGPAEVERDHGREPGVQRRGDRGRVAASGHRPQQDEPTAVHPGPRQQHVGAPADVVRHPADQALADQMQLHPGVVAEPVVLPPHAERARERRGVGEGMGAAFAVAGHVRDDDRASGPRPKDAHVLQLRLRLGVVVAVDDDQPGGGLRGGGGRTVEVGRHDQAGAALEDQVLDHHALGLGRAGDAEPQVGRRFGRAPQRLPQRGDPCVAEALPIGLRIQPPPRLGLPTAGLAQPGADVVGGHPRQPPAQFGIGGDDPRVHGPKRRREFVRPVRRPGPRIRRDPQRDGRRRQERRRRPTAPASPSVRHVPVPEGWGVRPDPGGSSHRHTRSEPRKPRAAEYDSAPL
jgi:hypothetical protein